jgi:hypothetical protein
MGDGGCQLFGLKGQVNFNASNYNNFQTFPSGEMFFTRHFYTIITYFLYGWDPCDGGSHPM